MTQRVADFVVRRRPFGPKTVVRVDLHGVSSFGPGDARTLIRWEWIEAIEAADGVSVRSASDEVRIPRGAFGIDGPSLVGLLEMGRSITTRSDAIARLNDR